MIHAQNLTKKFSAKGGSAFGGGDFTAVDDVSFSVAKGEIFAFLGPPMFFLSGALFPLKGLPIVIEWIARFNPLAYGVDGMRGALVDASHFGLLPDALILSAIAVLLLEIGGYFFSKIQI